MITSKFIVFEIKFPDFFISWKSNRPLLGYSILQIQSTFNVVKLWWVVPHEISGNETRATNKYRQGQCF